MNEREFTRRMVRTVLTVAAVGVGLVALAEAREALLLIYISALIAMGFSPLVHGIERPRAEGGGRGVPRWLAILSVYAAVVLAFVLVGLLVLPPLVAQATTLWDRLPAHLYQLESFLIRHRLMTHRVSLQEAVQSAPTGAGTNAVGTVLVAISTVVGGLFRLITILILSFYFLVEAGSLFDYLVRFVPESQRQRVATASRAAVVKVSAWMRANLVLAGVMGTFTAIGLGLLRVPYVYVVALVAAIGETVPMIGPIIAGTMAVAIALSVSTRLAVIVGLYFLALHQLESNILVPKIMERRVGVSPVTVMVALLIGGAIWGLLGAILAIPTAAILSVIVDELAASPHYTEPTPDA